MKHEYYKSYESRINIINTVLKLFVTILHTHNRILNDVNENCNIRLIF
jgi:hypothetical protein